MDDCTRTRAGRRIREICLTIVALVLAFVSDQAEARRRKPPEAKTDPLHRRFDLEVDGGPCTKVLLGLSRITEIQILFDYAVLNHVQCWPNGYLLRGEWTFDAALDSLLKDTNFTFDWVNDHTVAVYPETKPVGHLPEKWQEVLIRSDSYASVRPAIGSDMFRMTLSDIEKSGFQTVPELVHSDPQVFGGGPTEDTYLGREAAANASRGSGMNLRGLDAGGVVVLVDGHRIAMSGTAGGYADIANLPLEAIQSMSVMSDGNSLRYGADAVSGVVNFVTRNDVDGVISKASIGTATDGGLGRRSASLIFGGIWESGRGTLTLQYDNSNALPASDRGQATSDLRSWGGPNLGSPFGNPGTILAGGQTYALPTLIPATQNLYNLWDHVDVLASQRHFSLVGNAQKAIGDSTNVSIDGWLSRRDFRADATPYSAVVSVPISNPFYLNPTGGGDPVTVLYGFGNDLGPLIFDGVVYAGATSLGLDKTWNSWELSGSVQYAFEKLHESFSNAVNETSLALALADPNPNTAFNPFGGPNNPSTLAAIRDGRLYQYYSDYKTVTGSAERTIEIARRQLKLQMGAEFRQQTFDSNSVTSISSPSIRQNFQRNMWAGFAEIAIPAAKDLISGSFLNFISFSAGVRYENYTGGLSSTSPRVGIRWTPVPWFSLRGTWARSFRPPNLPDKANVTNSEISVIPDHNAGGGRTTALIWAGTNSTLQSQRGINRSLGIELAPIETISLSLTYFDIDSTNRVVQPILTPNLLQDPTFQGIVIRNPTQTERENVCNSSSFYGSTATCISTPVTALVDGRLQNAQTLTTDGFDLFAKYVVDSSPGKWTVGLSGTYLLSYKERMPHEDLNQLSTTSNPVNLRLRNSITWEWSGVSISAFENYSNHYRDIHNGGREVASWSTIDGQVSYRHPIERAKVKDFQIAASVQNLFDRYPPYVANPLGVAYDPENGDITGRIVSVSVSAAF
jgi:iron complex outermembrane recepter protein